MRKFEAPVLLELAYTCAIRQDDFEARITDLMNHVVEKLIGGIGQEVRDIKMMVQETQRKFDPLALRRNSPMGRCLEDVRRDFNSF